MTDAVSPRGIPISASDARALPRPVVAERLREARRARGLSREQVAAELGVSRPTLVNVEQGRRAPRPEELVTLARLYGRRVHEFTRAGRPVLSVTARFRSADGAVDGDTAAAVDDLQRLADDVAALEESVGASTSRRYPEPHDTAGLPLDLAAQQVAGPSASGSTSAAARCCGCDRSSRTTSGSASSPSRSHPRSPVCSRSPSPPVPASPSTPRTPTNASAGRSPTSTRTSSPPGPSPR